MSPTRYRRTAGASPSGASVVSALAPAGAKAETIPRYVVSGTSLAAPTAGTLVLVGIGLQQGQEITSITWRSGGGGAVGATNQWFSLWSSARAKLAVTADDTTAAWAANASKTLALTAPYAVPTTGLYYLGLVVVAGTMPTLRGITAEANVNGIAPIVSGTSDAALTNPASAPATAAAITATAAVPWAYVS